MGPFELTDLEAIVRRVLDVSTLKLERESDASSVPGWDSLQHTLIVLEINEKCSLALDPATAAQAKSFGELIDIVNSAMG